MAQAKHGWNIIMFLIVLTIVVLFVSNCFNIATHLSMTARMRYKYHQEERLLEGLLKYGIQLCSENKETLLRWGLQKTQTMQLDFDVWPATVMQPLLGNHAGSVSITSEQGALHINAYLFKNHKRSLAGSCDLHPLNLKNPKGPLSISHWVVHT